MMTLTDTAVKHLRTLLADQADASAEAGLRIFIDKGGCSGLQYGMNLDAPKAGDEIVERDGVRVLVDGESLGFLRGAPIDYCDDLTGTGFHVVRSGTDRPRANRLTVRVPTAP